MVLSARDQYSIGTASQLKNQVKMLINQPGGPPPIVIPKGGHVNNAINLIRIMAAMISLIMTDYTSPSLIVPVEHSIKLFLSLTHRLEVVDEKITQESTNGLPKVTICLC